MTLYEALKSNLPLTRRNRVFKQRKNGIFYIHMEPATIAPNSFIEPHWLLESIILSKEDILADDWIVKFGDIFEED